MVSISSKKIPGEYLERIDALFRHISNTYQTEAMVQIYYHPNTEEYSLDIPKQKVTIDSVMVEYPEKTIHQIEQERKVKWLVAEIHSHGQYNAFFSQIDNADEIGNCIYGVFGGYFPSKNGTSQRLFRAGTGGKYVSLGEEDIFAKGEGACIF